MPDNNKDTEIPSKNKPNIKKAISLETFIFLGIFIAIFGIMAIKLGFVT